MLEAIVFIQEDNVIRAYRALYEHICLNELLRTLLNEDLIIQLVVSSYFPFDYGINPKELKMESVGLIIKSKPLC
ncbi:hypothetical protein HZS_546 [Henneguya salminicola]|nr:hypothetical protein HZS_546 [Henneguya salminicola]